MNIINKMSASNVECDTYFAGLYVAHLIASPKEQPVKREKLRTHLSRVITLRKERKMSACADEETKRANKYRKPIDRSHGT